MATPICTINSISQTKISKVSGENSCTIIFQFDTDIQKWEVNLLGIDNTTGNVLGSQSITSVPATTVSTMATMTVQQVKTYPVRYFLGSSGYLPANTPISVIINGIQLTSEGGNRINIYGQGLDGIWTPYNQQ